MAYTGSKPFDRHPVVTLHLAVVTAAVLQLLLPAPSNAQLTSPGTVGSAEAPSVFLDCQGRLPCNRNHFRTEIQFVNWAQDREDADVHVIATSESVGGGGQRYILDFIGRGDMADLSDHLTYTSSGSDVFVETLDGLTQALRLGLMRYAVQSGLGGEFDVRFTGNLSAPLSSDVDGAPAGESTAALDPWNYWTFRIGLSGNLDLRETSKETRFNPSFSADRVTEDWKLEFDADITYQREGRQLSDGRVIRDDRDNWDLRGLVVRSISGHFSVGADFGAANSVSGNRDARIEFAPAVEYNYFPYAEANRRQLTVLYAAGMQHSNYIQETIFNLTEETRGQHELRISYNASEPWGNAGVGMDFSQYFHDPGLYNTRLNGNLNYRIIRGLDLNLNANLSWVQDEIHIPLSTISDEDILLGRQNLPSAYRYNGRVGLNYRWGSSFTNIVNTRF
ncbi:MAG: hypothetical protein WD766_08470 [Gemmatimonadota bacterium]